jgi:hypothetical protein
MELVGDMGKVDGRFGSLGDGVNLSVRYVHGFRRMYHKHAIHFGHTRCTPRLRGQMDACFDLFGDSVNLDAR